MKTLKPIMAALLTALFAINIISCSDEEPIKAYCDNFEYLELPDNTDFSNLTDYEKKIIQIAERRLNIHENDEGIFEIGVKSYRSANISKKIYQFFEQEITRWNDYILNRDNSNINQRKRLLTRGETFDDFKDKHDCMAYTLAALFAKNLEDTQHWVYDNYGADGVPESKYDEAIRHFNEDYQKYNQTNLSQISNYTLQHSKCLVIYKQENHVDFHAVIGVSFNSNGTMEIKDYQYDYNNYNIDFYEHPDKHKTYVIPTREIKYIYLFESNY